MLRFLVIFSLIVGSSSTLIAQKTPLPIESKITKTLFSAYELPNKQKRGLLIKNGNKASYNPLFYVASGLLYVYQNVFSAQISANCVYETSCSEYTKRCIQKHGIIKGSFIGLHQLSCCTPSIHLDYCEHMISETGKIINPIE